MTEREQTSPLKHWVYEAAERHRPLLINAVGTDKPWGFNHLSYMLTEIAGMNSPTKACRWLGWVQACLCFTGCATLDKLKAINKECSAALADHAAPQIEGTQGQPGSERSGPPLSSGRPAAVAAPASVSPQAQTGEREGFYEKLWKDFVSIQRGDGIGIMAKVEQYYREQGGTAAGADTAKKCTHERAKRLRAVARGSGEHREIPFGARTECWCCGKFVREIVLLCSFYICKECWNESDPDFTAPVTSVSLGVWERRKPTLASDVAGVDWVPVPREYVDEIVSALGSRKERMVKMDTNEDHGIMTSFRYEAIEKIDDIIKALSAAPRPDAGEGKK